MHRPICSDQLLVKYRSSIGQVSVRYRSGIGQVSVRYRSGIGQESVRYRSGIGQVPFIQHTLNNYYSLALIALTGPQRYIPCTTLPILTVQFMSVLGST